MIQFNEVLLDEFYSSIGGGAVHRTSIAGTPVGVTIRNVDRYDPIHTYQIDYSLLKQTKFQGLREFHYVHHGMGIGFRFKDYQEFWLSADGSASNIYGTPMTIGTGDGATTQFGISKTYTSGALSYVRRIVKPVAGGLTYDSRANTIRVYKNGVLQSSGVTVSSSTGILTFSVAPANSVVIAVTGAFDIPVTFGRDEFEGKVSDAITGASYDGMQLVEVLPVEFELSL